MRTKLDTTTLTGGQPESASKPYPSWNEMLSRLKRERSEQPSSPEPVSPSREWHDLVADMIIGR